MEFFLAFLGGVAAGYIGAVGGSGGLISLPMLLFLGLPTDVAIATNRFSAIGLMATAIPKYHASGAINWKLALKLVPLAIVGGAVGAQLLISIGDKNIDIILSVFLRDG